MTIKSRILRKIISNSYFWSIRHLVQPGWISSYANAKKNTLFIEDFCIENNINSILDYGCASGRTLFKIKNKNFDSIIYGIDINKKAIEYCKNYASSKYQDGFFFSSKLNETEISTFLNDSNISKFDLIIFDRVLYCLSKSQINYILKALKDVSSFIYIDDFYAETKIKSIGYKHRDWIEIFNKMGFECIKNTVTIQNRVENAEARSMIFKKKGS